MSRLLDRIPAPVRDHIHKWRIAYSIGTLLVIIGICSLLYFFFFINSLPTREFAALPEVTPQATLQLAATPQSGDQSTTQFVSGSEWRVKELLGKSTVDGYNSLDILFENVTTSQTANGHCQSKHDPHPEVDDIYTLINTGQKDEQGREIWLFSPHYIYIVRANGEKIILDEGINSKYQRFRLTQ